jgi:ubiquinone/menaquinone biosynthesis C-methylase UbiE
MTSSTGTTAKQTDAELKQKEEQFHDVWAGSIDPAEVMVEQSWNAVTCPEHQWIRKQLGDIRGKTVLDLGCGAGEAAVWFAKQGAVVTASDLSSEFLALVQRVAGLHGTQLQTHHADADRLDFPDNTFDIVYAGNVLHHVDMDKTLQQISRIMRPGGTLVTWDPLRHNPVINVYRRMAMPVRTEDEHPLHIKDVATFKKMFTDVRYDCFWFSTLWIFLRFYLIERIHPSKERYWKKVIKEHERLTKIYNRWGKLDRFILGCLPFLKRYCWNIAICARKPG